MNRKLSLKLILLLFVVGFTMQGYAQEQVENTDFENWDNLGEEDERPTNWNNMLNGDLDPIAAIGAQQTTWQSSDARPGSEGEYSVKIQTQSVFGVPVNGIITSGKMHAPSMNPAEGFTQTHRDEAPFYQSFTAKPDSLAVWVKYVVEDSEADMARISAIIHDNYDYTDPEQDEEDADHVVAKAEQNFQTNGEWMRLSIPFDYEVGASDEPAYILITLASSYTPGEGEIGATLYVDDLEMIYNEEESEDPFFFTAFSTQGASQNISFEMEDREENGLGDYTETYEMIINPEEDDAGNISFTAEFNQDAHIKMWIMNIPEVGDIEIVDTEENTTSPFEGTSPLLNALAFAPQMSYELLISGSTSGEPEKEVEADDLSSEIIKVTVTIDSDFMGLDTKQWEDFVFYPNPVQDRLSLKAGQSIEELSIYNTLGQKVKSSKLDTSFAQLDLSDLSAGVYFMKVSMEGKEKSFKLIKQ